MEYEDARVHIPKAEIGRDDMEAVRLWANWNRGAHEG